MNTPLYHSRRYFSAPLLRCEPAIAPLLRLNPQWQSPQLQVCDCALVPARSDRLERGIGRVNEAGDWECICYLHFNIYIYIYIYIYTYVYKQSRRPGV
jgi:hypothetical protein